MQMARMWDRSLSSTIRYLGAVKINGKVKEDVIEDELTDKVGAWAAVADAEVIVCGPGQLTQSGVKRLFHVAAVKGGSPGGGYKQIPQVEDCVTKSLKEMDRRKDEHLSSILFPLFGAGTARADIEHTADVLIRTAVEYLTRPRTSVMQVSFIARTQVELSACLRPIRRQIASSRLVET